MGGIQNCSHTVVISCLGRGFSILGFEEPIQIHIFFRERNWMCCVCVMERKWVRICLGWLKMIPRFKGRPTPIPIPHPTPNPVNTWPTLRANGFSIRILPPGAILWFVIMLLLLPLLLLLLLLSIFFFLFSSKLEASRSLKVYLCRKNTSREWHCCNHANCHVIVIYGGQTLCRREEKVVLVPKISW